MGKRITIDPITRLEGHLRIEVEVAGGKVVDAWASGQMFRGIEMILKGRDPQDAHHFVQRSCGVCTYTHALASVRAVEAAIGVNIPDNARIIRNLMHAAQFQHDHIVHFYHLHALDWVDVVSALKADPLRTAKLADSVSNAPWGGSVYFRDIQQKLQTFVDSGQLGPLNNAYWGHPAYQMPPEANLMAAAHYIEALRVQARTAKMHAIFGGKNPHAQFLVVGGITSARNLSPNQIAEFVSIWKETQDFVKRVYIPDLLAVASFYKDWSAIGGTDHFLSWGDFAATADEAASRLIPRGMIRNRNMAKVETVDQQNVTESVTRAWYEEGPDRHPYEGETKPRHSDYRAEGKYSWSKAPRYKSQAMEVGPLARTLLGCATGHEAIKPLVESTLKKLGIPPTALFSTLGRTAARGLETVVIGDAMEDWVNQLAANLKSGNNKTYESWEMPDSGSGHGLNDVPRGALGHWIEIKEKKIKNYQYVVPSTWNFSPRCSKGIRGPVESALIGTPVADAGRPLEILRTVHSFDPCLSCAIHVIDPHSNEVYRVRAT